MAPREADMRHGEEIILYRADGAEVIATAFYTRPNDKLAQGFVTEDGRIIFCEDEEKGLFWFEDTQEKLYRDRPSTQS